jgi:hypothetical protein
MRARIYNAAIQTKENIPAVGQFEFCRPGGRQTVAHGGLAVAIRLRAQKQTNWRKTTSAPSRLSNSFPDLLLCGLPSSTISGRTNLSGWDQDGVSVEQGKRFRCAVCFPSRSFRSDLQRHDRQPPGAIGHYLDQSNCGCSGFVRVYVDGDRTEFHRRVHCALEWTESYYRILGATLLTASIPATDVAGLASAAITVTTGSNSAILTVYRAFPLAKSDIIYDRISRRIFASAGGTTETGNSITPTAVGSLSIPDVDFNIGSLVRWGEDGLAFRTGTRVYLIRIPATWFTVRRSRGGQLTSQ